MLNWSCTKCILNVTATKKICFKCNFWLISILKFCSLFTYPIQVNDYISVIHCFHLRLKLWISCGTKIQNEIFSYTHFDCFTSNLSVSCRQFPQIPRAENPVKVLAHQKFYPKHQVTDLCWTYSRRRLMGSLWARPYLIPKRMIPLTKFLFPMNKPVL